jgi:hypothetical protein
VKSNGRICPHCNHDTRVVDKQERAEFTYRRHECRNPSCGYAWSSRQFHFHDGKNPHIQYPLAPTAQDS